jgi:alkyl sulfatase BDS1-like metallo-beta-lactamase superfamily hydrolase
MAAALSITQLFDSLAIRIDGRRAWDSSVTIRWHFTDPAQTYRMELSNGALVHYPTERTDPADLVVTLTKQGLLMAVGRGTLEGLDVEGDPTAFTTILGFTDAPDPGFAIVTP